MRLYIPLHIPFLEKKLWFNAFTWKDSQKLKNV